MRAVLSFIIIIIITMSVVVVVRETQRREKIKVKVRESSVHHGSSSLTAAHRRTGFDLYLSLTVLVHN